MGVKAALKLVQGFRPEVTSVVDAKYPLSIRILPIDINQEAQGNHAECAVAEACKRAFNADDAIIGTRSAFMILGEQAFRYRIPSKVSHEIKSFDQGKGFQPGLYTLAAPNKGEKLGAITSGRKSHNGGTRSAPKFRQTRDVHVRAVLGTASKNKKGEALRGEDIVKEAMAQYNKASKNAL